MSRPGIFIEAREVFGVNDGDFAASERDEADGGVGRLVSDFRASARGEAAEDVSGAEMFWLNEAELSRKGLAVRTDQGSSRAADDRGGIYAVLAASPSHPQLRPPSTTLTRPP